MNFTPVSCLIALLAVPALAQPLLAQTEVPVPEGLLEKVAYQARPFRTLDATYNLESGPNESVLVRQWQVRVQVDLAADLYREEQVRPHPAMPYQFTHNVAAWDGKVFKFLDHEGAGGPVRLGMPLSPGNAYQESEKPPIVEVLTDLYTGRTAEESLSHLLLNSKDIRGQVRSENEFVITLSQMVRLVVDPRTGLILAREDLERDSHCEVYPWKYRQIEQYALVDGRPFPTRIVETFRDERARVVKGARYTVDPATVRLDAPLEPGTFSLEFPEGSRLINSRVTTAFVAETSEEPGLLWESLETR